MDLTLIVNKVLNGEKEEFRNIVRECNQPLYRTAIVILKNESDAEDAIQSAYLKAYLHLQSFRAESSFLTWITRILINECKMLLRKRKDTSSLEHKEVIEKQSNTENAVDSINRNQMNQMLEKAVLELPEKYRLVYVIREVNELSTENTAAALGLTEENVKVRLHRAKSLIRENLLKHAPVQEMFPFGNQRCNRLTERVMLDISQTRLTVRTV
jgi:RNA polymerase sigma factor (sigma-70 family)